MRQARRLGFGRLQRGELRIISANQGLCISLPRTQPPDAPLALRERVAFVPEESAAPSLDYASGFLTAAAGGDRAASSRPAIARVVLRGGTAAAPAALATSSRSTSGSTPTNSVAPPTCCRSRRGSPCVRVAAARFDGARRAADPRQMKQAERLRARPAASAAAEPPVPAHLRGAKEVRSSTEIGAHSVRWPPGRARRGKLFGELADSDVLCGAGEMIELTATHIARAGRSRSPWPTAPSSGHEPCHRFQGQAMRLAECRRTCRFDIVVSCTASTLRSSAWAWSSGRSGIDAAADVHRRSRGTRDVEPRFPAGRRLRLHGRRLGRIVTSGTESRQAAVAQAEAIIESRVRDFDAWIRTRPRCR